MAASSDITRNHLRYVFQPAIPTQGKILRGVRQLAWWTAPSAASVVLVHFMPAQPVIAYLSKAEQQGVGPELWNVFGTLAFALMGLSLLRPRSGFLAEGAYNVLMATFGIGALTVGILTGQLVHYGLTENIPAGDKVAALLMLPIVFAFSLVIWLFADLVSEESRKSGFLHRWLSMDRLAHWIVGGGLFLLMLASFGFMR